ncbi:dCTP deaminase [Methylobacterium sp. Leaf361]|uniref:dCTP deaminase n=1 Tax=Methylobacterium sp. Leaf361 TaxID=1736352 RepID=UPI0009E8E5BC|nr:dCTP deaminase [Methylobacterium sp. Leaf361]
MQLLHKTEIETRLAKNGPDALYIDPLLDARQVGEVTLDLRLGTEFLVSLLTRKAYIGIQKTGDDPRGIATYFRPTRRELGDRFILYPNQVVLASTLEYIGLPNDVYADVLSRSSYTRLGVDVNTMVQPGFRGCLSIELFNHGNSPVELVVGSRVLQARLFSIGSETNYHSSAERRKYFGTVRPVTSRAPDDEDLKVLENIREVRSR